MPWDGHERVRLHINYVRSLEAAGLTPVIVAPLAAPAEASAILATCAGLLLTGGEDVDAARYGEAPHATAGEPHRARDATEVALLAAARDL
ncbi:MAG TPA: gamma-glutamyl-gamma-aminobutyrate hydrolase family protein, partial [Opitutus sp.]|nr:gamma-glutamyl-gamma-aminobutyrate hydrolase family protein [Opitutus sp.]